MEQVLPCGIITWRRGSSMSTLDLVFMTPLLRNSLVECRLSQSADCHSDHEPICTVINLFITPPSLQQKRNWKNVDIPTLQTRLATNLQASKILNPTSGHPADQTNIGLNRQIDTIIEAIQDAVQLSTPFVKICSYMRPGFTTECKKAQMIARKLKKR